MLACILVLLFLTEAALAQAVGPPAALRGTGLLAAFAAMMAAASGIGIWIGRRSRPQPAFPGGDRGDEADNWASLTVELVGVAIFVWDTERGTGVYCNPRATGLFGWGAQPIGKRVLGPSAALDDVMPGDRAGLRAAYRAAENGQGVTVTYRHGRTGHIRQIRETIRPVKNAAGQVTHVIAAATEMPPADRDTPPGAEAEMLQSLGRLTSGIAHDFNNILAVVLGNLELMEEVASGPERDAMLQEAITATERGRDLTRTMLGYARRAPDLPEPVDLNAVARELAPLLRRTIPENICIQYVLHDGAWPIVGDRSLADSALLNLALNARDAMPAGGQLTVSTELETGGSGGPRTVLRVEDTGTGIDPAVQARLFDPFVSSKGPHRNSGLGLAMVQSFVERAGGAVEVNSRPGVGSCFRLYFPAVAPHVHSPEPATQEEPVKGRPARILVVEDDAAVRDMLARQLRRAGHHVETAENGVDGERTYSSAGPFDLLLADLVVPGPVQGPDLADRLRQVCPALRVLFVSAYARPDVALKHPLLQKPLGQKDLLRAVSGALAG